MSKRTTTLTRLARLIMACSLALALVGLNPHTARAASLTVTTTSDSGAGSLRQAIADAAAGDTITFSLPNPSTITLASELRIGKSLTITGPGASALTISGNNAVRVFSVSSVATLNLSGVTVANGRASAGDGGGITNLGGTLTVSGSTFTNNSAASDGGGIFVLQGALTVSSSTFTNNTAAGDGGGVYVFEGTATVSGSTFTNNTATGDGGGIYVFIDSVLTISSSTFSGNTAAEGGGIYNFFSELSLRTTRLTNNRPGGNCGGFINLSHDDGGNRTDDRTCEFFSNPNDIRLTASSVAEAQPAGTTVGSLITNASGGTYTYALVSGAGDTDNGSFTISDRFLKTAAVFDYETKTSYSIRVQLTDDLGLTVVESFTINVTDVVENVAPVANNDSVSTREDTTLTGNVLANDSDADGDTLTAAKLSDPAHGALTLSADGSFSYAPAAGYSGPDSFTYKANDGALDSNVATVSITVNAVNDAPVAADDSISTREDTTLTGNVLANDSDPEGDALTATLVAGPAHGALTLSADGSFSYTPAANYSGPDSFTYKANDGALDSNVATVSITMNAVNDAPVAADDGVSTREDTTLTSNVLANDSDPEGDALTATLVAGPAHGALTLNADGSFSYTPAANYSGPDSFTYSASDGALSSNVATVSITVNAVNDAPTVAATAGGVCLADFRGLARLSVADAETAADGLTLSATSSNPTLVPAGNITFGGSGATRTITIATASGRSGSATITITVRDGASVGTTTITVVAGTSNNDTLNGTSGADMLFAGNSQDTLSGGGEIDLLCGGQGDDQLTGGDGDDTLDAGQGQDRLDGGAGSDQLLGGQGDDLLIGGDGDDALRADQGNDRLDGGAGSDQLFGDQGDDTLTGGASADHFDGGANNDRATDYSAAQGDTQVNIP